VGVVTDLEGSARRPRVGRPPPISAAPLCLSVEQVDARRIDAERQGRHFAHDFVRHGAGEWGKEGGVHTNTIEGYFSISKRGMKGTYHHCGKKHLHRYMAEFDFRYNHRAGNGVEDGERAKRALAGAKGRRLTYRRADG
jgi:hypothetical protein